MVSVVTQASASGTTGTRQARQFAGPTFPTRCTPAGPQGEIDGLSLVRQALVDRGLSQQSIDMVLASWRDSTKKQYLSYVHRWLRFCNDFEKDIFTTEVAFILNFLTCLFNEGLAYSAINTARSALSSFLGVNHAEPIGSHVLVIRFMKGVARSRPALPRYRSIWDVNAVLNIFRMQPLANFLSLYDLTLKSAEASGPTS